MTKKSSYKRREASSAGEEMANMSVLLIKLDVDSHTLVRLLVVFHNFTVEDVVHEDHDVSIKKDYLDNAIKFSMTDIKKGSQAKRAQESKIAKV